MKPSKFANRLYLLTLLLCAPLMLASIAEVTAAETGSITGSVYCDQDKNGICDCEENGLGHIDIRVFTNHCGGTALQSTSTDEKGDFTFRNLDPGTYFILVDLEYVCGGRVPTTSPCKQVMLVNGENVDLPPFGYSEFGQ